MDTVEDCKNLHRHAEAILKILPVMVEVLGGESSANLADIRTEAMELYRESIGTPTPEVVAKMQQLASTILSKLSAEKPVALFAQGPSEIEPSGVPIVIGRGPIAEPGPG